MRASKLGKNERHVFQVMKDQVFALYEYSGNDDARCVRDKSGRKCEIYHLISREPGGADVIENLWPQAYGTSPYNAQRKDTLEHRLNKEVCVKKSISLREARGMLVNDWRKAYRKYYGTP